MKFLKLLARNGSVSVAAIAFVWVAFCVVVIGAAWQSVRAFHAYKDTAEMASVRPPQVKASRAALTQADYAAIAEKLPPHPGIEVKSDQNGVRVVAKNIDDFERWRLVVDDVQLSDRSLAWEVRSVCAGKNCPEGSFVAALSAIRQQFVVQ